MIVSDDESNLYGMEQGCAHHGDEYMTDCDMCGIEFCRKCLPQTRFCHDCLETLHEDDELDDDPDFEDVKNLNTLIDDDREVEALLNEEEDIPPEDLIDEEDAEEKDGG